MKDARDYRACRKLTDGTPSHRACGGNSGFVIASSVKFYVACGGFAPRQLRRSVPCSFNEKLPPDATQQTVTVNISPQILNAYVEQYEIAPNQFITITSEVDKLMGVMTRQPKVELSPASETRFVVKEANAEVNFFKEEQGRITHLIVRLNGDEMRGRKIK